MLDQVAGITRVRRLYLQLLYKCNFSCKHCFHGELLKDPENFSLTEAQALLDRFKDVYQLDAVTFLGAEYMMPVEPRHFAIEHYLPEGRVRAFLPGWHVDWETYTPPFVEAPHVEQLAEHVHRMGLIIATQP